MAEITYTRKLPNWIQGFRDWTIERSQMSELLIDWAAVWTIAAALRRRIAFTRHSAFLGSWDCYPYLYVKAVGPAGVGKTTAVRYAFDLLDQVPSLGKPPTFTTVEGIIDAMLKSDDSSSNLVIEEFGDIMMKDHSGKMFQFLTSMYDGKANIRQHTMQRQLEFADKPCLNMFAGTTQEWIADNIPTNTLNGGYGSRVIWLAVPGLRRRRMYYRKEMQKIDFNEIEKKLVADLNHIATNLEGEYSISDEALDFMEEWNEHLEKHIRFKKIAGYIMRKPVFVHKLALVLQVAESDTKIVTLDKFKQAIAMLDKLELTLPRIFEGVGKNEYSFEMRDIADYIKENPGIPDADVREYFKNAAAPQKIDELITGLLMAKVIKSDMISDKDGGGRKFTFARKE